MVGATPFLRAAESGDTALMRLLVANGADANMTLADNTAALMLASGVGHADGSTFEWSEAETLEAVKLCLELGNPLQAANRAGLTAMHGAAHRGSNAIVEFLFSKGAKLDARDAEGRIPLNWAEGVAIIDQRPPRPQPHTIALLRKLMAVSQLCERIDKGLNQANSPPREEGWPRHQAKWREATLLERTGWSLTSQVSKRIS